MTPGNRNPAENSGCRIDIQRSTARAMSIFTIAPRLARQRTLSASEDDHVCPPVAAGACVPVSLGSKPKQSRRRKLDKLLANTHVPSALAPRSFI